MTKTEIVEKLSELNVTLDSNKLAHLILKIEMELDEEDEDEYEKEDDEHLEDIEKSLAAIFKNTPEKNNPADDIKKMFSPEFQELIKKNNGKYICIIG